ncbi:hypothetical protein [Risungbinella massiliensis]|uniref:hypothetical protein n=1 Tax=Risungbinella massiliensis TaxID=1329796 RepID=UPI0005CBA544|nr:hypothetical protein [Risungbinella massiliensis]
MEKKTKKLLTLFASVALMVPLAGCADDDIELCYDDNKDGMCDDDGSYYDKDSYVVVDGKTVAYIKNDSYVSSGSSS